MLVNRPAAVIYDALTKAGYEVELEEFDGLKRNSTTRNKIDKIKRKSRWMLMPCPGRLIYANECLGSS